MNTLNGILIFVCYTVVAILLDSTTFTSHLIRVRSPLVRVPLFAIWFPWVLWVKFLHCLFVQPQLLVAWVTWRLWSFNAMVFVHGIQGRYVGRPYTREEQ